MKVTFVYPDIGHFADSGARRFKSEKEGFFSEGVASLSAILKKEKHKVSLIHITHPTSNEEFINLVSKHSPDLLFFSSITHMFHYVKQWATAVKQRFNIPIVVGGVHPTLNPEETIKEPSIDMICIGEGEEPVKKLVNAIQKKKPTTKIKGIWVKKNSKIYKNPAHPLIENLDKIPFADLKLFNLKNLVPARTNSIKVMMSRGCPYSCTYCSNHTLREIYPNKYKYARFRSVDNTIKYIKEYIKEYPEIEQIDFNDNILHLFKDWTIEFAKKYKKEINLPFQCRCRANLMDEETTKALKEAGCFLAIFGVESGNEFITQEVLKRNLTIADIRKALALCRKYGIRTISYNMVGLPFETLRTMLDTIKINAELADQSQCFIFYPYPNTELYKICEKNNFLTSKEFDTNQEGTILNQESVTEAEVMFAYTFFNPLVKIYSIYSKLPWPISQFFIEITDELFCFKYKPHKLLTKAYKLTHNLFYSLISKLHNNFPRTYRLLRSIYIGKDELKEKLARKL